MRFLTKWACGCLLVMSASIALAQPGPQPIPSFGVNFTDNEVFYDPTSGVGTGDVKGWIEEDPANTGFPHMVQGWSMSLHVDATLVDVTSVVPGAYVATVNNGGPPGFFTVNTNVDGFTVGCVYDLFGGAICFYDVPKEAVVFTCETVPSGLAGNTVGTMTPLSWQQLGSPPVQNLFVLSGGISVDSDAVDGTLSLTPLGGGFLRGDVDGNGSLSAIPDAVAALSYLFNMGSIPCLDAADYNDDGSVNLPDPIAILNWGFTMGPDPAAPYPFCGADPTNGDVLDCATFPTMCP